MSTVLGVDDKGKELFAQYVPIRKTLAALFKSKSMQEQYEATRSPQSAQGIFRDVSDGKGVKFNPLF